MYIKTAKMITCVCHAGVAATITTGLSLDIMDNIWHRASEVTWVLSLQSQPMNHLDYCFGSNSCHFFWHWYQIKWWVASKLRILLRQRRNQHTFLEISQKQKGSFSRNGNWVLTWLNGRKQSNESFTPSRQLKKVVEKAAQILCNVASCKKKPKNEMEPYPIEHLIIEMLIWHQAEGKCLMTSLIFLLLTWTCCCCWCRHLKLCTKGSKKLEEEPVVCKTVCLP